MSDAEETEVVTIEQPSGPGVGLWSPSLGGHVHQLGDYLTRGPERLSATAFQQVATAASSILGQCLPHGTGSARRTGIIVGYVGSPRK